MSSAELDNLTLSSQAGGAGSPARPSYFSPLTSDYKENGNTGGIALSEKKAEC